MTTISERRQHLDFDSSWQVVKWDASDEFVGGMSKAFAVSAAFHPGGTSHRARGARDGVKGADVVGVRGAPARPRVVLVAEFKDFAHPRIPPHGVPQAAEKSQSQETIEEIVRKIIDTLAGATFSHDANDNRVGELAEWRPALGQPTTKVFVLVCVEAPDPLFAGILTKELQLRLKWLGADATVLATSSATPFNGPGISYRV